MAARGINHDFITDLLKGQLKGIFDYVISDDNLSLEIRDNYINIYYKGGNLLRIAKKRSSYEFAFNTKYCLEDEMVKKIKAWKSADDFTAENLNAIKTEIDNWMAKDTAERRFQHEVLLNCSSILDIEYQVRNKYRIDMILSNGNHIVLVENKCGIGAISSRQNKTDRLKPGIRKHYRDFVDLSSDNEKRKRLIDSVNNIIANKCELGLMKERKHFEYDAVIDFLFVLYDYNHRSKTFSNEVEDIKKEFGADIEKYDTRVQFIEKSEEFVIDFDTAISIFNGK